jgi:2-polyprenyl-6-methoxyphenol hydroxylase-like FAD-dependent oxidoreductase
MMYDVIIVGARCAGAPLTMLLARRGATVLLVDRATFPSDIPHGHFIHRHGPQRLKQWGLLDKVAARTPAITNMLFDAGDFPLSIFIGLPAEELPYIRGDIASAYMQTLDMLGDFGTRVRAGRREERFYGASDLPHFYRKPYGPGWALVGDAGLHKDPYLALGICDALRDVAFLADAISAGLSGRRAMPEALAEYEQRRNDASAAEYDENIAMARFTPLPPQVLAIRAAVRHLPAEAARFMKARVGMINPAEFFNPQHLQHLLDRAAVAG